MTSQDRTSPRARRASPFRPVLGALAVLVLAAGFAPAPASAAPTMREIVHFTGNTFNRLCNDAHATRFALVDTSVKTRICHAAITAGRLVVEVRYRRAAEDRAGFDREASGIVRQEVSFNARSRFYCSDTRSDGYATLYMNCLGEISASSRRCSVTDRQLFSDEQGTWKETYRQSFANIVETSPDNCTMLKRAFNYIAARSRDYQPNAVRDFLDKLPY